MINLDSPAINAGDKSNAENMQQIKAWAIELIGQLNYQLTQLESEISVLKSEINKLKGED